MATERGSEETPTSIRKVVKMAGKKLRKVRKAAVLSFSWDFVCNLETRTREGDQAGFYKHLKTMKLERKRDRSSTYVKDENGVLLRGVELICDRWVRWFHTLEGFNNRGGRGCDDFVLGEVTKTALPGIGLHDPLHDRQDCPEFIAFDQGVGQICPQQGLFSCRSLPKRGQICYIPAPPPNC